MLKHLCPCCGRHCYLDDLQCERGMEYAQTGVIPPRRPKPDGNGEKRQMPEKKRQYLALDRDGKLIWNLRELGAALSETETDAEMQLACLREEDRADLLMLLEKLKHSLHHKK
ncbi:MAG: hypothetical protein IJ480_02740 [Clostridia bacterium]|nr:hypothetical protein [Clostridia bacterium]